MAQAEKPADAKPADKPADTAAPATTPPPAAVPEQASLTQTEMDVLQKLSDRRAVLDGRPAQRCA